MDQRKDHLPLFKIPSHFINGFLTVIFAGSTGVEVSTLNMDLIPLNFALIGAAATLSASLYAPFTSVVLIYNLLPSGYQLFLPILVCCFISFIVAKLILPYNVYTYDFYLSSRRLKKKKSTSKS
ncbi:chloride channel protein [Kaistella treverensis]|uniref:chloride channel protein n=1 Tax=Kaistella treverensis TaxID=631455 RepID=UPI000A60D9AE|nr:chloride channel protein [Kaistella treverensis]